MASSAKAALKLARLLFNLSVVDGAVSAERVQGVLEYVEKHNPGEAVTILRAYRRLVAYELAKSVAVVEHAGSVDDAAVAAIAAAMTRKYSRKVAPSSKPNPSLLAGLRVQVGDDIYESSVAGQLAALTSSV
jgi:F-type H+-transporting ATPase subunit delta